MKILPVGAELSQVDGWTDGYDQANIIYFLCERPEKLQFLEPDILFVPALN